MTHKEVYIQRSNVPDIPEGSAPDFIAEKVVEQNLFFCDRGSYHWFFDFKIEDMWVSSIRINNELTKFSVEVFR